MRDLQFSRLSANKGSAPLLALYRRAIASIDDGHYSESEKQLWIQWADVPEAADRLLRQGITVLASREEQLQGFGQILPEARINMLYVDPACGRQGVGSALIQAMEQIARYRRVTRLTTRASHASRPVFQRVGFIAEGQESIPTGAHTHLEGTVMVKDLWFSRR